MLTSPLPFNAEAARRRDDGVPATDPAVRVKLPVELAKLSKRLHRQVARAIADFAMIGNGDRVMVCVSGG